MSASKAHIRATTKFENKTYDKVTLRIRKDGEPTRDEIIKSASEAGQSLNAFVLDAVKEKMGRIKCDKGLK